MANQHGVLVKRDRAQTHLSAIEKMIDAYAVGPYALAVESDPVTGRYIIRSNDKRVLLADQLATNIGDCVHNMRSALDYIAWELAGARQADNRTMFPICETEELFNQRGRGQIKDVRPETARALIEDFQPFKTPEPRRTALWLIEHFDATDKHRLLPTAVPILNEILIHPVVPAHLAVDSQIAMEIPPLNTAPAFGETLAIVSVTPPVPEMTIEPTYTPNVSFGDDGEIPPVLHVVQTLRSMQRSVNNVIDAFSEFFG